MRRNIFSGGYRCLVAGGRWEACPEARKSEDRNNLADAGAVRILTEGHYLYDIVDASADFSLYKVLILPDDVPVWPALGEAIRAFTASGGKLLATGRSGLDPDGAHLRLILTELERRQPLPSVIFPSGLYSRAPSPCFICHVQRRTAG